MILVYGLLILVTGVSLLSVNQPRKVIVLNDYGIILQEVGSVGKFQNHGIVSLLISLRNPRNSNDDDCGGSNGLLTQVLAKQDAVKSEIMEILQSNPTSVHHTGSRRKRFLGLELFNLYSTLKNAKTVNLIKKHLNDVDAAYNRLSKNAEDTVRIEKIQMKFNEEIIHLTTTVNRFEQFISCRVTRMSEALDLMYDTLRWEMKLRALLQYQLRGNNHGELVPDVLPLSALHELTVSHPRLKDTLFSENPSLFYKHTELNLVAVSDDLESFHFVLVFPLYTSFSILYKMNQVGFYRNGTTLKVANEKTDLLSVESGVIMRVNKDDCHSSSKEFMMCRETLNLMTRSCLHEVVSQCPMKIVEDGPRYVETDVGVLIYSNSIKTENINNSFTLKVQESQSRTYFVDWKTTSKIVLQGGIIERPEYVPEGTFHVTRNYTTELIVNYTITVSTTDLGNSLKEQEKILANMNSSFNRIPPILTKPGHLWTIVGVICFVVIVIIVVCGYVTYRVSVHGPLLSNLVKYVAASQG